MPFLRYIGPMSSFTVPRWGIGDTAADTPFEVTDEAYADLVTQPLVFEAVKAKAQKSTTTGQEG